MSENIHYPWYKETGNPTHPPPDKGGNKRERKMREIRDGGERRNKREKGNREREDRGREKRLYMC